ncbi:hypothetical protein JCM11491_002582 [Sporobolomyces phaffii]
MSLSPSHLTPAEFELIRPLTAQLFPPADAARDSLLDAALAPLAAPRAALDIDSTHAYQHVDFWDERKLAAVLGSVNRELGYGSERPKLELTRQQLEEVKAFKKGLKRASREADAAYERDVFEPPPSSAPTLSGWLYLTSAAEQASRPQPLPSLSSFLSRIFPSPADQALELARAGDSLRHEYPTTKDVMAAKYTMTRAQLESVRQYRQSLTKAIKESRLDLRGSIEGLRKEIERDAIHLSPALARGRLSSPELFPSSSAGNGNFARSQGGTPETAIDDEPAVTPSRNDPAIEQSERRKVAMEVDASLDPTLDEPSLSDAKSEYFAADQSPVLEVAAGSTRKAATEQRRALTEEQVERVRSYRLGPPPKPLPSLGMTVFDSLALFTPTFESRPSAELTYELDWNPLRVAPESTEKLLLEFTQEENDSRRRLRQDARELRAKLTHSESEVDVVQQLRDEIEADSLNSTHVGEHGQEEDPFEFSDRRAVTLPTHPSPPLSNSPDTRPPFPPPYTLYKRRATSLPSPSPGSLPGGRPVTDLATGDARPREEGDEKVDSAGMDLAPDFSLGGDHAQEKETPGSASTSREDEPREQRPDLPLQRWSSTVCKPTPAVNDSPPSQAPVTLPFPTPSFLDSPPGSLSNSSLRVVVFDPLLQMTALSAALERAQFQLVHRPSRFPFARFAVQDPHVIVSDTACVLYFKLIDLIGNAVRDDPPNLSDRTRQESILTTLCRFSATYDHVLVVFEEQQASRKAAPVKAYSYTPLVLSGLTRLAEALDRLSNEKGRAVAKINVVCSTGPEYSADVTRKFASFVEQEDGETAARSGVAVWGDRNWLTDNPQPDESLVLERSPLLNEVSVCAILSIMPPSVFTSMSRDDMVKAFASTCGHERITQVWTTMHPTESQPSHVPTYLAPSLVNLVSGDISPRRPSSRPPSPRPGVNFDDVFDFDKYIGE